MLAQRLRHRITIKRLVTVDVGESTRETWPVLVDSEPAEVVDLSGKEYIAAAAVQAEVSTRITVRQGCDVRPKDKIEHEGVTYDVRAVLRDPSLRRHLSLMCQSGVSGG